jgi:6-pyruvoyl-tetrahydropterin synthase related domain
MQRDRLPYLLITLAAFIAIIPLLANGCSCGHDFDFHILSWMEAARQFTHGNFHPHWAYTPAWNAGEPRFVFYPPLSWTVGAILGLIFPWTWTPILYTWLALTAAGLSLYLLAREFTTTTAATVAAVIYTVNPYMLFTAYERTAYAELLAAAFIPLLLHAILRRQVTIPRIAIPIALLWLTNAPAAVMSCYALALLALIRIATKSPKRFAGESSNNRSATNPGAPYIDSDVWASRASATAHLNSTTPTQTALRIAVYTISGTTLGIGLAAFYILPAAYERRFVQIAMAIIPFYRIQDNFLFHQTGDIPHDQVLHTASLIAILLLALTAIALVIIRATNSGAPCPDSQTWASRNSATASAHTRLFHSLIILTIAITLLLTPLTKFIWTHAPELAYLQFPWRLLAILAAVLAFTIALALTPLKIKSTTTTVLTLLIAAALTYPAYKIFHQACDPEDTVQARLTLFHSNQGTDPTDEYTPTTSDNDSLAGANPPYWLSPDPNAKAPANTGPGPAPTHLTLNSPAPEDIILNLRDYPTWRITLNGTPITNHIPRGDGLIALSIPAGPSTIDIAFTHPTDQTLGTILTAISLILLLLTLPRPFAS